MDLIISTSAKVKARVRRAALRSGRPLDDIVIIGVTKTHGPETVVAGYEAGIRHFGENRVEEMKTKIAALPYRLTTDATWHMIGAVQSRKANDVARIVHWVHSVDRLKIAQKLNDYVPAAHGKLRILLEINITGEESKSGYRMDQWPNSLEQYTKLKEDITIMLRLPNTSIEGLMTIPPVSDNPQSSRPIFTRLRLLRDTLRKTFPDVPWTHLSMGMTDDFEVAIEEGATMVRIGRALFGERHAA